MAYNPFSAWKQSQDWDSHIRTAGRGGEDYPLSYGTRVLAPAAGELYFNEYPPGKTQYVEFQNGWVGSAGRRAILMLTSPIRDVVAVVFQHLSSVSSESEIDEGESIGLSGASANNDNYGGEVHLHIHCLTANGTRRKFTDYFMEGSIDMAGSEEDLRKISDSLTLGVEGKKFDGDVIALLKDVRTELQLSRSELIRIGDALTIGKEGVKFDGDMIAAVRAIRPATVAPVDVADISARLLKTPAFTQGLESLIIETLKKVAE